MSRLIESRENLLWSRGTSPEKDDSIAIYISGVPRPEFGLACPYSVCDVMILSPDDWKLFKKYGGKELLRLEKMGISIKKCPVRNVRSSLFQTFDRLQKRKMYLYFASIAEKLVQNIRKSYNPIIQKTIRGINISEENHRILKKMYCNRNRDPIKYFISYAKMWDRINDEISIIPNRKEYEKNVELYEPDINSLPDDIIFYIKLFLF